MTRWVKGRFESEIKSFTTIANKIIGSASQQVIKKQLVDQMLEDFKKNYNSKNVQQLKNVTWRTLQGTESWNSDTMTKIEKHLNKSEIDALNKTIVDILSMKPVSAPIIMMQNNVGMLVCGEYTLIACRLLNIQPKVVMF